ncbi:MAG: hypothetical protein HWE13_05620 [Gammaproteobacteria bacterium]|nr:hypothetical protein [Gammaproteobacteria bacterium]
MKGLKNIFLSSLVLLSGHFANAVELTKAQDLDLSQAPAALILLHLNVDSVAPSLIVEKLIDGKPASNRRKASTTKLSMDATAKGLYLASLAPGDYQVIELQAPYFDLPYRLNLAEDPRWRFTVAPGQTNYIGMFQLNRERKADEIYIKLINRIATDLPIIQTQLEALLAQYPLVVQSGIQDDFLKELTQ